MCGWRWQTFTHITIVNRQGDFQSLGSVVLRFAGSGATRGVAYIRNNAIMYVNRIRTRNARDSDASTQWRAVRDIRVYSIVAVTPPTELLVITPPHNAVRGHLNNFEHLVAAAPPNYTQPIVCYHFGAGEIV